MTTENKGPKGIDLEMLILGHMLIDTNSAITAAWSLHEEDFALHLHGQIFAIIKQMEDEPEEITWRNVSAKMPAPENGAQYLKELIKTARALLEYYKKTDDEEIEKFISEQLNIFEDTTNFTYAYEAAGRLRTAVQEPQNILSGLEELDFRAGGFRKGELSIIAGRPSMGKTSFAAQLAGTASKNKKHVLFFSLQNSAEHLFKYIACAGADIDRFKLKINRLTANEKELLEEEISNLSKTDLVIDDTPALPVNEIYLRSIMFAQQAQRREHKADMIIIDSFNLIRCGEMQTDILRRLKELARTLDVAVIVTLCLNRRTSAKYDYRPQMEDLPPAAAGADIYASLISFLYRPYYYKRDDESLKNKATLIIAQNRAGGTGDIGLNFNAESGRFLTPPEEILV